MKFSAKGEHIANNGTGTANGAKRGARGKLPDEHQLGKTVPLFTRNESQDRDSSAHFCGANAKAERPKKPNID
jgi:hypothetical protein